MNKTEKGNKVILKREKESVIIDKGKKTVEFSELSYTFDEVLYIAHEIAETFDDGEEPSDPDDGSWKNR